jgi:SAM-dependent methyltransferase
MVNVMSRDSTHLNANEDTREAFIDLAYRLILGRPADTAGMVDYKSALAAGLAPVELLRTLLDSDEYQRKNAAYDFTTDPDIAPYLTPSVDRLSARLQACDEVGRSRYEKAWSEVFIERDDLIVDQRSYGEIHKERFWELVNAVSLLIRGKDAPRILEIGASEFSGIYRKLFPQIRLDILDRPYDANYIGFTEAVCRRIADCENFYAIDLADHRTLVPALEKLPQYDLILMTEVLEHLPIHPLDLLPALIQRLAPDGAMYLTTPNCFAYHKLLEIKSRSNPQPIYPRQDGNWDAHHHYREYAAKELFKLIDDAGGKVEAFYFSGCWNEDKEISDHLSRHPDERGNMVFVVMQNGES